LNLTDLEVEPKEPWQRFQREARKNGACLALGHNWIGVKFQKTKAGELKVLLWECPRCEAKSR